MRERIAADVRLRSRLANKFNNNVIRNLKG
jgi:hypothetical protein